MSRRLLLEEDLGSTSACRSQPDNPVAESGEAQNTTSVRSQHGDCAKVRCHEPYEPETTCGAAKLWNLKGTMESILCTPNHKVNSHIRATADIGRTCSNNKPDVIYIISSEPYPSFAIYTVFNILFISCQGQS